MSPSISSKHSEPTPWRGWRVAVAALGWALTCAYFVFATLVLVLRYWVLPDIGRYSREIEEAASQSMGERVTIGRVSARWQGLHPELDLSEVRIYDRDGRVALSLPTVEAVVGWRALVLGALRLNSLAIEQPDLDVRRYRDGRIFIAGIELRDDESGPHFSDWLLSQEEIVVRNAQLAWDDELRGAPTLALSGVTLVLQNSAELPKPEVP